MNFENYPFPPRTDLNAEWRDRASCNGKPGNGDFADNAWIAEDSLSRRAEDELCASCPVRQFCVVDALLDPDSEGNRGGFYFEEGKLSREDSHRLWNEMRLKSRLRNRAQNLLNEAV